MFGGNGIDGATLINKAVDVSFNGCYFLENDRFGLNTSNGISLLSHCGFENNHRKAPDFASGGAGAPEHFREVFQQAGVSGALAASVFHTGAVTIPDLKSFLADAGIEVRP